MGDGGKHDGNDLQKDALSEKLEGMSEQYEKEHLSPKFQELSKKLEEKTANEGYIHKEAYCIMKYKCKRCGSEERIWNSRDGVTPFGITCPFCKGADMLHVDWHGDIRDPLHVPKKDERIFVDMPEEVHRIFMMKRINMFWHHEDVPMRNVYQTTEKALVELAKTWNEGEPFLIKWETE